MAEVLTARLGDFFQPILGQKPWSAKVGWGSFLSLEFGPKTEDYGHVHGAWHLWIYQCDWKLISRGKTVVHSESTRHAIELAVRRLETMPFQSVRFDATTGTTYFGFGHMEMICGPYPDAALETEMGDSEYWMFFLPNDQVLSIGRDRELSLASARTAQPAPRA